MSTFQRLTLIGLYNHVPTLFDRLVLPPEYDRETFIDTVLLDQGEKRVAYPEPDFFTFAVGVWSRKWANALQRIALALSEDYNPIHNYDRYEKWTEHEEGDYKNKLTNSGDDITTLEGSTVTTETGSTVTTETGTTTETTTDMETERSVSAFNDSTYQPNEKSVVNGVVTREPDTTQTVTPDTTQTVTPDTTQTFKHGAIEDGTGDDRRDREHEAHLFGNIGVTTSQKMVEDEIELRRNQNMYSIAAELFADDLLLMLY